MPGQADDFIEAISSSKLCLYPTDTVWGLGCDPFDDSALQELIRVKQCGREKPFLGLVGGLRAAQGYWEQMPSTWAQSLEAIWPAPLTVVWRASEKAPKALVSPRGEIALRVPYVEDTAGSWLGRVLHEISFPLLSTSVNLHGEKPLCGQAARSFCKRHGVWIPQGLSSFGMAEPQASTVVRIGSDASSYTVLRHGCYPVSELERVLAMFR